MKRKKMLKRMMIEQAKKIRKIKIYYIPLFSILILLISCNPITYTEYKQKIFRFNNGKLRKQITKKRFSSYLIAKGYYLSRNIHFVTKESMDNRKKKIFTFWDTPEKTLKEKLEIVNKKGILTSYNYDERVLSKIHLVNYKYFGKSTLYYTNSHTKGFFSIKNNNILKESHITDSKGTLIYKNTYSTNFRFIHGKFYKNGKEILSGSYTYFYDNGNKFLDIKLKNGKLVGKFKKYFENGNPAIICTFKDGALNGLYSSYYPNNKLNFRIGFRNNSPFGKYESYFESSILKKKALIYYENKNNQIEITKFFEDNTIIEVSKKNIDELFINPIFF